MGLSLPDGTIDPDMPMAPAEASPPPQPTTAWHAMPAARVLAALQVDPTNGLPQAESQPRLAQHGPNALPEAPPRPARSMSRWSI